MKHDNATAPIGFTFPGVTGPQGPDSAHELTRMPEIEGPFRAPAWRSPRFVPRPIDLIARLVRKVLDLFD